MGRTTASRGLPPASSRKDARAKRAKQTINKDIPAVLQSNSRARKGVESSELIVDPPPVTSPQHNSSEAPNASDQTEQEEISKGKHNSSSTPKGGIKIRLQVADTFEAAHCLIKASTSRNAKTNRVAVLNMASPLRAGGGFLNGASSQEESLCMRSTLYPALKDEFYRLPEVGGVWTSDVLVFRPHHEGAPDLPKNERFFVDVVSSAMLRHPDLEEDSDGEKRYASAKDRDMVERKMRAVIRMLESKGVKKAVLGAWGCGAFGNPVGEVARLWKKVLLGGVQGKSSLVESWDGMDILFAIKEAAMAASFAKHFGGGLEVEAVEDNAHGDVDGEEDDASENENETKIAELRDQIAAAKSPMLRDRLKQILEKLEATEHENE